MGIKNENHTLYFLKRGAINHFKSSFLSRHANGWEWITE
jgi:hypothetical protein